MPKDVCCVYKIQLIGSEECWVGSTTNLRKRIYTHRWDLKRGKHSSKSLQNIYDKQSFDAFEVVILTGGLDPNDKAALRGAEQAWIDRLHPVYNKFPAVGSRAGMVLPEEERRRRSERMQGNQFAVGHVGWLSGKTHSAESRKKISEARTGKPSKFKGIPRSDDLKAKVSAAKRGVPWSAARKEAFIKRKGLGINDE